MNKHNICNLTNYSNEVNYIRTHDYYVMLLITVMNKITYIVMKEKKSYYLVAFLLSLPKILEKAEQ